MAHVLDEADGRLRFFLDITLAAVGGTVGALLLLVVMMFFFLY